MELRVLPHGVFGFYFLKSLFFFLQKKEIISARLVLEDIIVPPVPCRPTLSNLLIYHKLSPLLLPCSQRKASKLLDKFD